LDKRKFWKIVALVLGVGIAMVVIPVIGIFMYLSNAFLDDCSKSEIFSRYPSPDHRHEAVVFATSCGEFDGWKFHMSVMSGEKLVDTFTYAYDEPQVRWTSAREVLARFQKKQERIDKKQSVGGVRIRIDECEPKVQYSQNSPNDEHAAYIYETCGQTGELEYQSGAPAPSRDESGNVLQSFGPFRGEWKNSGTFVIHYDPMVSVSLMEKKYGNIDVIYQPFPPKK
jgi:hypothetical protein